MRAKIRISAVTLLIVAIVILSTGYNNKWLIGSILFIAMLLFAVSFLWNYFNRDKDFL
jgi:hypothetical protein